MLKLLVIYAVGLGATAIASLVVISRGEAILRLLTPRKAVGIAVVTTVSLLILQILKLLSMRNFADFAAWVEIIDSIARGNGPICSIQEAFVPGAGHWFSAHFTPWVYLFAVPYLLVSHPATLLVSQSVVMVTGPVALFFYARSRLDSPGAAAYAAAALAVHPTYQYIQLYEFEMLRFCIPLIIATLFAWRMGWRWAYWGGLAASLLVREEVALVFIAFGLVVAVQERSVTGYGVPTAITSMGYFVMVVLWVMPSFRESTQYSHIAAGFFSAYGATPQEAAMVILSDPVRFLGHYLHPIKVANVVMLLAPFAFLPLAAPLSVAALGNLAVNMLSISGTHTSYFLYYVSPALAFLAVAAVDALPAAARAISMWHGRAVGHHHAAGLLFVASAVAAVFFSPAPYSLQFWASTYSLAPFRTQRFHVTDYLRIKRFSNAREASRSLTSDSIVSAEQSLLPIVAGRAKLLVFPDVRDADFVFLDRENPLKSGVGTVPGSWDGFRLNPEEYYSPIESSSDWVRLSDVGGMRLYRRRAPSARETTHEHVLGEGEASLRVVR